MENFLLAGFELIRGLFKADETLASESRYGDSPAQRASRRSCQWGCFVLFILAVLAFAAWEKWG